MKKISAFLIIMIAMLMAGVCAHAADFSVDTTSLPMVRHISRTQHK